MEKKQQEYQVVQSHDLQEFSKRVSSLMQSGWFAIGGVAVVRHSFDNDIPILWYQQALVRYENN